MHPGLVKLARLRFRAGLRQSFRGLKTVRGALLCLLGVAVFITWLGPSLVMVALARVEPDTERFRSGFPLAMLGITLLYGLQALAQKGVSFSVAEVDFLFSAPLTRRQLLLYKIAVGMPGLLLLALFFSVFARGYAPWWIFGFLGIALAALFLQLVGMAVALVSQTVGEYAYTWSRRAALALTLTAVALVLGWAFSGGADGRFFAGMEEFRQSLLGRCLAAPTEPFARVITARSFFPELVVWGSLALGIDLALLALVMKLDVNYLEASLAVSQRVYERLQRARRGSAWVSSGKAWGSIPPLPWLGGAGPIARIQLIKAARSIPNALVFIVVVGTLMLVGAVASSRMPSFPLETLFAPLLMLSLVLGRTLGCDFRGHLDHMEALKVLPLRPAAVAAGQVVTPILLLTAFQLLLLGAAAPLAESSATLLGAVALFVLPFNAVLLGAENFLFLVFPVRMVSGTAASFQHFGRGIVEMFLKMVLLLVAAAIAGAAGLAAFVLSVGSWIAALAVAWLTLAGIAALLIPCVAWAFRRFDVSTDTPG